MRVLNSEVLDPANILLRSRAKNKLASEYYVIVHALDKCFVLRLSYWLDLDLLWENCKNVDDRKALHLQWPQRL